MKKVLFFLSLCLLGTSALAGGSIFWGHKSRTSNPEGVSSIGVHICGSLDCPDVILKKGDCGSVEHATTKYGVCVCDDGFYVEGDKCISPADITDKETCLAKHYKWFECPSDGRYKLCMDNIPEEDCILPEKQWYTYYGNGYCMINLNTDKDSCLNAGNYWVTIFGYEKPQVKICVDRPIKINVFCELNNNGNGGYECGPGTNHYTGEELVSEKDCFCGEA